MKNILKKITTILITVTLVAGQYGPATQITGATPAEESTQLGESNGDESVEETDIDTQEMPEEADTSVSESVHVIEDGGETYEIRATSDVAHSFSVRQITDNQTLEDDTNTYSPVFGFQIDADTEGASAVLDVTIPSEDKEAQFLEEEIVLLRDQDEEVPYGLYEDEGHTMFAEFSATASAEYTFYTKEAIDTTESGDDEHAEEEREQVESNEETTAEEYAEEAEVKESAEIETENTTEEIIDEDMVQGAQEDDEDGVPFEASKTINEVTVHLFAEAGAFDAPATLSVTEIDHEENLSNNNVAKAKSFDIKVLNDSGEEIQPKSPVQVTFEFESLDKNTTPEVFHEEEQLYSTVENNSVVVETTGFSIYTVEFTYGDKEYVLEGDAAVRLDEILAYLKLSGEVTYWEVSNNELFTIIQGDEYGIDYNCEYVDDVLYETPIDNPDGDILYMVALQMFNTEEWLKIVIDDIEYEIQVTDDNIYQNVPSPYSGNISTNNDDNIAITGDPYFLDAPKPDYVMQSQSTVSATDFAAGLPLSTIFIDVNKIGHGENTGVQGEFKLLTENEAIKAGFEHYYNNDSSLGEMTGDIVRYNPLADTENLMQIEPNKINVLEGDLFQFTYKDAAILPNGETAHVRIIYSNAKIAVDQRLGITDAASGLYPSNYQGYVNLARGATVNRGGTDERYLGWTNKTLAQEPNQPFTRAQKQAMVDAVNAKIYEEWGQSYTTSSMNSAPTPVLGQSIDVKYQVVDDAGNPIDGTFIFAVTGINLDRDPYAVSGNNLAKPIWTYTADDSDIHFFSEAMSINQGQVSDYIYVRPNTNVYESTELKQNAEASNPASKKFSYYYAQVIEDSNGNVKFIGNNNNQLSLGGNDKSYNAGFVVLANAKDGITVTSTGHASSRYGMNTQAYGGVQIWYRYTSWTGPGGTIQTTSEGNYGGTLNDASDKGINSNILDAGTYVVPEGKDVTYTMAPHEGYQIKRLRVKNANGTLREIKFNSKPLSTMEEGDTYSFNDAAGRRCTLTALADGKFKLVMPYAKHDEEVRVEWERTTAEIKIKKSTVDNLSGTFNFKVKAHKKEDVTTYAPELIGSVWKDAETGLYNMQLTEGITCALEVNELVGAISPAIYSQRLEIDNAEYAWGNTLWKTNTKLSDLGFDIDDDLFVGFANVPSSVEEETVSIALDTGYSAAGPERIYIYNPKTTVDKDVITHWNFNTLDGQETDPGWHNFTVDAGDEKVLTVQKGYEYEVQEVNNANWELLDVDGNPIQSATGVLDDEVTHPEHEFLNREVPDLTIKKETVNDVPGTFEFKIKAWTEEDETETNRTLIGYYSDFHNDIWSESIESYDTPFTLLGTEFGVNDGGSAVIDIGEWTTDTIIDGRWYPAEENRSEWFDVISRLSFYIPFPTQHHYPKDGAYTGRLTQEVADEYRDLGLDVIVDGKSYPLYGKLNEEYVGGTLVANSFYGEFGIELYADIETATGNIVEKYIDLSSQFGEPDDAGYYHFTLDSGESLNIPNLHYGAKYEVIEVEQDGWRLTDKENDKGEITNNTTATFTNEKLLSLTVKKETDVDTDEDFDFEIRIIQPEETLDFPYNEWTKVYQDRGEEGNQGWESDIPGSVAKEFIEKYYPTNRLYIETLEQTHLTGGVPEDYPNGLGEIFDVTENGFSAGAGADNSSSYFEYSLYSSYLATAGYGNFFMDNSMATGHTSDRHLVFYLRERYIDLSDYGTAVADEHNNSYQHDDYGYDNPDGISDNGFYRFKLKSGESLTIPNIPYSYQYEVYEIDKDGNRVAIGDIFNTKWELKSKTNDSGTLTENTTSVFTNEIKKGSINVKKETKGNEGGEFAFKIKILNYNLSSQFGEPDENGYYEFTLSNDEEIEIPDIPYGYNYEIYEETPGGWELISIDDITTKEKAEGTIESETPYEHTFLNAKKKTLKFGKTVASNMGNKIKKFTFTAIVSKNPHYESNGNDTGSITADGSMLYEGEPLLSASKLRISLSDVRFAFDSGEYGEGYTLTEDVMVSDMHKAEYDEALPDDIVYSYKIGEIVIEGSPVNLYLVANHDFSIVTIDINDADASFYDSAIVYDGNIRLDVDSCYDLSSYGGRDNEDGSYTFTLAHGEFANITNIPYGYTYEVTENDYSDSGYTTTIDGNDGRSANGTLTEDKEHTFVNTREVAVPTSTKMAWAGQWFITLMAAAFMVGLRMRRRKTR